MDANELLNRLRALNDKKKGGGLDKGEALELRRLKLEQQSLKLTKQKAALNDQKRKIENKRKFELGGIVQKAGLDSMDNATLLGALLEIANVKDVQKITGWRERGGAAYGKEARDRARANRLLIVTFPTEPSEDIRRALRGKGFTWIDEKSHWEGTGVQEEITALVGGSGTVEEA